MDVKINLAGSTLRATATTPDGETHSAEWTTNMKEDTYAYNAGALVSSLFRQTGDKKLKELLSTKSPS